MNQMVRFDVKPEYLERFRAAAIESLRGSLDEPGNLEMKLFNDSDDPTAMYVFSRWKDQAAIDFHNTQPHGQAIKDLAPDALRAPPEVEVSESVVNDLSNVDEILPDGSAENHSTTGVAVSLELLWRVDGFSEPESVLAPAGHDWVYVSNVNGDESGFISRLTRDGRIVDLAWLEDLGTPTGMCMRDGRLYVVNRDRVEVIAVETGTRIETIVCAEADALNDIAIDAAGRIFLSDINGGKIFALEDGEFTVFFEDHSISHPNGIHILGSELYVGDYGTRLAKDLTPEEFGSLHRIDMMNGSVEVVEHASRLGGLDGVVSHDGGLFVSSNPTGKLFAITASGRHDVGSFTAGLADIDIEGGSLFAPNMIENSVEAHSIG